MFRQSKKNKQDALQITLGEEFAQLGNDRGIPTTKTVNKKVQIIKNQINSLLNSIEGEAGGAGKMKERLQNINQTLDDFVQFRVKIDELDDDLHEISKLTRNLESDAKRLNKKYSQERYLKYNEDFRRFKERVSSSSLSEEQKDEIFTRLESLIKEVDTKNRVLDEKRDIKDGPKEFEKQPGFFDRFFSGGKKSRKQRRRQTRKNRRNRRTRRKRV